MDRIASRGIETTSEVIAIFDATSGVPVPISVATR